MTEKKLSETVKSTAKTASSFHWGKWIGEVKQEIKKVDWTTSRELKNCTKVVVISTFVFGFFVYVMDLIIHGVIVSLQSLFIKVFAG